MVLFLLNLIFSVVATISNLLSRVILTLIAGLVVLAIQAFKLPGEAIKDGIEQLSHVIKLFVDYLLDLLMEVISNLISSLFDLIKEGISGSISASGFVIRGLMKLTVNLFDGLMENLLDVLEGFAEMVSTIITDLWDNYKDALGYVTENA